MTLVRRLTAEFFGTAFLLAAVVGSGIMGGRLASGNLAIALLANTLATGAALVALILTLGTISGAHFNPAVTVADALRGGIAWREAPAYIVAQIAGAFSGVGAAHIMFGLPLFSLSLHARSGGAQLGSEFIATFGLLSVIWGCSRTRPTAVAFAVGAYITAAYWFTASTSFANGFVLPGRSRSFLGNRSASGNHELHQRARLSIAKPQLSSKFLGSLPHSPKANANTVGLQVCRPFLDSLAIIPHRNDRLTVSPAEIDPDLARFRMLEDIGERFLNDAEDRGLQFWRKPREVRLDLE